MATQNTEKRDYSKCRVCREFDASVLCEQCDIRLCTKCETGHKNIPFTKDHTFKHLIKDTADEGSASYDENGDIFCSEHPSNVVAMICDDCAEVYCSSCAHAHSGHKAVPITADIHHIQQISMESLQNMIAGFKGLGQRKKDIATYSTLWEEAESVVTARGADILKAANSYVDSLCENIKTEKKYVDSKLSGQLDSVSDRLTKTDEQISKLNLNKTSAHRHLLLRGIQLSTVTQKLNEEFMKTSNKYKDVPTINRLLPNIGKADDVKELMKSVFTLNVRGCQADVDFTKFGKVAAQKIGSAGWRLCDDGVTGHKELVLLFWFNPNISAYKDSLSKLYDIQSGTVMTYLVKISETQSVSANKKDVTLLNSKYQVVKTKNDKYDTSEYDSKTICSNGENSVIECCIRNSTPYKLQINSIDVKNNDLKSTNIVSVDVNVGGDYRYMHCRKRGDILVFGYEKQIRVIDLITKSVKLHDVSNMITGRILSVSLDVLGYILIGDEKYVHVYKKSMDYVMKLDIGGSVTGIVYVNDTLFISKYPLDVNTTYLEKWHCRNK